MDFSFEKNELLRRITSKPSPDEIQKWREQRKMMFVTKANIDLKERRKKVLFDRGERIKKSDNLLKFNKIQSNQLYSSEKKQSKPIVQNKTKQFESNERKNEEIKVNIEQKHIEPVLSSGLTLLSMYSASSDSELEEGEIKDKKFVNVAENEQESVEKKASIESIPSNNSQAIKQKSKSKKIKLREPRKIKRCRSSTESKDKYKSSSVNLMRRLLSSEIQHERNMIMQCVCFIVKNNFFDDKQQAN